MKPVRPIHGDKDNYERVLDRTHDILNGSVSFGSMALDGTNGQLGNMDAVHVMVTLPTNNVDATFTHNLNRIPTGFIVVNLNQAAQIWRGSIAWTSTTLTLRASLNGTIATLLVY